MFYFPRVAVGKRTIIGTSIAQCPHVLLNCLVGFGQAMFDAVRRNRAMMRATSWSTAVHQTHLENIQKY